MLDRKKIIEKLEKLIQDKSLLSVLGEQGVDIIYRRVKSGYGLNSDTILNPTRKRLKPLSTNYVRFRKGQALFKAKGKQVKFNFKPPNLGEFGSAGRSNLTLSGQMLKSLTYRATSKSLRIYIPTTRRVKAYKWDKNKHNNAEIAKFVSEDRPFMGFTQGERRILEKELNRRLKDKISRIKF